MVNFADRDFCRAVRLAFENVRFPEKLIRRSANLEAERLCSAIKAEKFRVYSAFGQVAFSYVTPIAGLWLLPMYIIEIYSNFQAKRFSIHHFVASLGNPEQDIPTQFGRIGSEMAALASDEQVAIVNEFLAWLKPQYSFEYDVIVDDIERAEKIWKKRAS